MENTNMFLLRIILASIVIGIVAAKKTTDSQITTKNQKTDIEKMEKENEFYLKPSLESNYLKPKHKKKKSKMSKRDSYNSKYWASRSSNFGYGGYSSDLPLYLVYNRKVGAYYPYYKYPKDNNLRRSGNIRRVPNQ